MTSRIVPDLFLAVACSVLNRATAMNDNMWILLYLIALLTCVVTYKAYPLNNWREGVLPSFYTFVFVLYGYNSNDWKEFGNELHLGFLGHPFALSIIQFLVNFLIYLGPKFEGTFTKTTIEQKPKEEMQAAQGAQTIQDGGAAASTG